MQIELEDTISAIPAQIYAAWLDSAGHTAMTGAPATASREVGGSFSAWNGYIQGRNLELVSGKRIVQAWRTADFTPAEGDSRLEITMTAQGGGCRVRIVHSQLPPHGMQYHQGWIDHYFTPMKTYFGGE